MTNDICTRLQTLISQVHDAREEFYQVAYGRHARQVLGSPASEAQIQEFERRLSYPLPPSYRQFLLLHDGWKGLEGDADLLSLAQRSDKGILRRSESLKKVMHELSQPYNSKNLLIVGGADSTYVVYLDFDSRRPDGEMDIVEYTYEEGELARHASMEAFLKSEYDDMRELIKSEKGADAGPDAGTD